MYSNPRSITLVTLRAAKSNSGLCCLRTHTSRIRVPLEFCHSVKSCKGDGIIGVTWVVYETRFKLKIIEQNLYDMSMTVNYF